MSRKHYREVAEIIKSEVDLTSAYSGIEERTTVTETLRHVASGLSHMFGMDNGNFDRDKFMKACGL